MFLLILVLSFSGLVSAAFKFNFSTVEQCAPVQITFSGNDAADSLPSSLLLLPFNATPFSIPIPNVASNSTGVTVTFLPLAAGTQFIASLDNSTGDNSARISDVFKVQPSPIGDDSCLPPPAADRPFTLPASVTQCEPFAVGYQVAAPAVRVFFPNGGSFPLDVLQDDIQTKTALYTLKAVRGFPIVLMMFPQDDPARGMTTPLLTVGGDASSDTSCLDIGRGSNKSKTSSNSTPTVSKGLIIGLAVGGSIIMLLTLMMIVYLLHQRRRRRRRRLATDINFDPNMQDRKPSYLKEDSGRSPGFIQSGEDKPSMAFPQGSQSYGYTLKYESDYVKDPPYTSEKYSPSNSDFDAQSTQTPLSWIADPPVTQYVITRAVSQKNTIHSAKTASSINPYDIEGMLDAAAADDQPEMPRPVPETKGSSPKQTLAPIDTSVSRGRHFRTPSDVPVDPSSVIMSAYSNMFMGNTVVFDSPKTISEQPSSRFSYASSSNFEILTRPSNIMGSKQPSSRFSDVSITDNGVVTFPRPAVVKEQSPRDSAASWGDMAGVAR